VSSAVVDLPKKVTVYAEGVRQRAWAHASTPMPKVFCLDKNFDETLAFLAEMRSAIFKDGMPTHDYEARPEALLSPPVVAWPVTSTDRDSNAGTSGKIFESGKRNDRPELTAALAACKKYKAKLIIAKLDRPSRNLAFIATLMDSGVEFIAVDNPHANKLTVHILAAVAQHEQEMIGQRTRDARQAAKARGKILGNPELAEARKRAVQGNKSAAARYAANVLPVIREIQASGVKSLRGVARALAARGIATARGGAWTPVQVSDILRRGGWPSEQQRRQ
jgi:DNA invertase Pin-like site-specific DNA recombinase